MSTNNNSTNIIVKGSIFQEREEEDYPDPTTSITLPRTKNNRRGGNII
jgi:hypothetical protein